MDVCTKMLRKSQKSETKVKNSSKSRKSTTTTSEADSCLHDVTQHCSSILNVLRHRMLLIAHDDVTKERASRDQEVEEIFIDSLRVLVTTLELLLRFDETEKAAQLLQEATAARSQLQQLSHEQLQAGLQLLNPILDHLLALCTYKKPSKRKKSDTSSFVGSKLSDASVIRDHLKPMLDAACDCLNFLKSPVTSRQIPKTNLVALSAVTSSLLYSARFALGAHELDACAQACKSLPMDAQLSLNRMCDVIAKHVDVQLTLQNQNGGSGKNMASEKGKEGDL